MQKTSLGFWVARPVLFCVFCMAHSILFFFEKDGGDKGEAWGSVGEDGMSERICE